MKISWILSIITCYKYLFLGTIITLMVTLLDFPLMGKARAGTLTFFIILISCIILVVIMNMWRSNVRIKLDEGFIHEN